MLRRMWDRILRYALRLDMALLCCMVTDVRKQLPRANKICPKCRHDDAVFFQSQQRTAETGMVSGHSCSYASNCFNSTTETFLCLLWLRSHLPVTRSTTICG